MNNTTQKQKRKPFSKEEKQLILQKTDGKCAHCGKALTMETATIDHLIPLHKGGLNDEFNLIAMCYDCNQAKSNYVYHILDYCHHINPKYLPVYHAYHKYAINQQNNKQLFDYHEYTYAMFPPQQKQLIKNMAKRNKKNLQNVIRRMGVKLSLSKAWEYDSQECFDFIQKIKEKQPRTANIIIYDNEQQIFNEIRYGEVYILKTPNDNICGLFAFRHIKDDTFQFPQLQNIIQASGLHTKYLCTTAIVDGFAYDVFGDIMNDITGLMLKKRFIPMYFNVINYALKQKESCISIPYQLDGHDGTLEWMPMSYIREMILPDLLNELARTKTYLEPAEIEILLDAMIKYRTEEELTQADTITQNLFQTYPTLKQHLEPPVFPFYNIGFVKDNIFRLLDLYFQKHPEQRPENWKDDTDSNQESLHN